MIRDAVSKIVAAMLELHSEWGFWKSVFGFCTTAHVAAAATRLREVKGGEGGIGLFRFHYSEFEFRGRFMYCKHCWGNFARTWLQKDTPASVIGGIRTKKNNSLLQLVPRGMGREKQVLAVSMGRSSPGKIKEAVTSSLHRVGPLVYFVFELAMF